MCSKENSELEFIKYQCAASLQGVRKSSYFTYNAHYEHAKSLRDRANYFGAAAAAANVATIAAAAFVAEPYVPKLSVIRIFPAVTRPVVIWFACSLTLVAPWCSASKDPEQQSASAKAFLSAAAAFSEHQRNSLSRAKECESTAGKWMGLYNRTAVVQETAVHGFYSLKEFQQESRLMHAQREELAEQCAATSKKHFELAREHLRDNWRAEERQRLIRLGLDPSLSGLSTSTPPKKYLDQ